MSLVFESERLIFRPLSSDDVDIEVEMWTDPEVVKYITGEAATEEDVANDMPMVMQRAGGGCIGIWTLTVKETAKKIGHAVLLPLPVEVEDTEWHLLGNEGFPDRDIEIGYVLKRTAWGKGYATEACSRLLDFAFSETTLDTIVATTDEDNEGSKQVLRKCGLIDQGHIRAFAEYVPGFKITRDQWMSNFKDGA